MAIARDLMDAPLTAAFTSSPMIPDAQQERTKRKSDETSRQLGYCPGEFLLVPPKITSCSSRHVENISLGRSPLADSKNIINVVNASLRP